MKILVLNGPNINMLGIREKSVYGEESCEALLAYIKKSAEELGVEAECFQSNSEGELVSAIQQAYGRMDGIVINPAAYTHTSVALLDALKAVGVPAVEVHISDPDAREPFRSVSYVRAACMATVKGRGLDGYVEALRLLCGEG